MAIAPNGREASLGSADTVNDGDENEFTRLGEQTDLVKLGLAGNLRDFSFETSDGSVRRGDEIDYRGVPAGYADEPDEVVSYVDAHDNETLFDILTLKLPVDTSMEDRVRMNTLSLATTTLSQTPTFWHAGTDLLRSKSLDRDSYNSGDWFNKIDWTGQSNNFGVGLPVAEKNEDKWVYQGELLANPDLKPSADDIAISTALAQDLLKLRYSTKLFRLGTSELINEKVTFPVSVENTPGVIVMRVNDTVGEDVDGNLDNLLVVFNTNTETVNETVSDLAGHNFELSDVQQNGADAVVRQTAWNSAAGQISVPARTVAVLVEKQATDPTDPTDPDGQTDSASVTLSTNKVVAGEKVGVKAQGFAPGEQVQVWLAAAGKDSLLLVTQIADDNGQLNVDVTVPSDTAKGKYQVKLQGLKSGKQASADLEVVSPGALGVTGFAPWALAFSALLLAAGGAYLVVLRNRKQS